MTQLVTAAVLHQQMSANQIRQTRTLSKVIVSGHEATWSKLGACKEIAELLKWSAVLQRETHQAGNHVVENDKYAHHVGANLVPNNNDTG
jgi:hypothetical protein